MYENDRRKKLNALGDFENKTPTHMDETHAISNSERNFQIRIPREIPRSEGIGSNFLYPQNQHDLLSQFQ